MHTWQGSLARLRPALVVQLLACVLAALHGELAYAQRDASGTCNLMCISARGSGRTAAGVGDITKAQCADWAARISDIWIPKFATDYGSPFSCSHSSGGPDTFQVQVCTNATPVADVKYLAGLYKALDPRSPALQLLSSLLGQSLQGAGYGDQTIWIDYQCPAAFVGTLTKTITPLQSCGLCLEASAAGRKGAAPTEAMCNTLANQVTSTWAPTLAPAVKLPTPFSCSSYAGSRAEPVIQVCSSAASAADASLALTTLQSQDPKGTALLYSSLQSALTDGGTQATFTLSYLCPDGGKDSASVTGKPPAKSSGTGGPSPACSFCVKASATTRTPASSPVPRAQCNSLAAKVTSDWAKKLFPAFPQAFSCAGVTGSAAAPVVTVCSTLTPQQQPAADALMDAYESDPSRYTLTLNVLFSASVPGVGPVRSFDIGYTCPNGANKHIHHDVAVSSISGTVFTDTDKDGKQDAGEAGIDGVTVLLQDMQGGGNGLPTATASDGTFAFHNILAGTYQLKVLLATPDPNHSWSVVSGVDPSTGLSDPFTVADGKDIEGMNIGLLLAEPQDCPVDALSSCYGDGKVLVRADCNGDGAADYTCTDAYGKARQATAVSSASGCDVDKSAGDGTNNRARLCAADELKCSQVHGYTAQANMDTPLNHNHNIANINKGQTAPKAFASWDDVVAATATACSGDSSCRGFSSLGTTKMNMDAKESATGVCLYTKGVAQDCSEADFGNCYGAGLLLLATTCVGDGAIRYECVDSVSGLFKNVVVAKDDSCATAEVGSEGAVGSTPCAPDSVIAANAGDCPYMLGYDVLPNIDAPSAQNRGHVNDGQMQAKPFADWYAVVGAAQALCDDDPGCAGFSSLGYTKSSMAFTQGSYGTCLYAKDGIYATPDECSEASLDKCYGSGMLLLARAVAVEFPCAYACLDTRSGVWASAVRGTSGGCVIDPLASWEKEFGECQYLTSVISENVINDDPSCLPISGYTAQTSTDTPSDQNLDHVSDGRKAPKAFNSWGAVVDAARTLCDRDPMCFGFSSLGYTKASVAATQGSPGTCLYTKDTGGSSNQGNESNQSNTQDSLTVTTTVMTTTVMTTMVSPGSGNRHASALDGGEAPSEPDGGGDWSLGEDNRRRALRRRMYY